MSAPSFADLRFGLLNDWPPLFSAAFPVFAFVAVAVSMLWWLERR